MNRIHSVLEAIARRDIPANTDLWPQIAARIERKDVGPMNPRLKLSWTVVLVLLGLVLATTAAYAVYRYFDDPGLQAVRDAGLIQNVNATARPTGLPSATPFEAEESATRVGKQQTLEGVAVTLDWVYLQDSSQAFHISASGLAEDMRFGMPVVTFADVAPEQYRGAIFSLDGTPVSSGTFIAYQLLRKNGQFGGKVDLQIDLPLLRRADEVSTQLGEFHFDLKDIPVIVPMGAGGGNAYAVRVNGLEMRLEYTVVTPAYTEAQLCYQSPSTGDGWGIQNAGIQFINALGVPTGKSVPASEYDQISPECAQLTFPVGKQPGDVSFLITANDLAAKNDPASAVSATWQFSTLLIDNLYVQGISPTATPAPLVTQIVGDLRARLDWAYADANRVMIQIHFDGLRDVSSSVPNVLVKDKAGHELGYFYATQTSEADPSTLVMIFNPQDPAILEHADHVELQIEVPVFKDSITDTPFASFHFDLDLKVYPALVMKPGLSVSAKGIEMRLEKIKMSPSYTNIYLCFKKPTSGLPSDWLVSGQATLQVGGTKAAIAEMGTLFDADYGGYMGKGPEPGDLPRMDSGRCVELGFPVGNRNRAESATLTIPQLEQSIPELIPDDQVRMAREKLKTQGIDMDWQTISGNGGGAAGPIIKHKPDGMTDEQVLRLFYEALGYT